MNCSIQNLSLSLELACRKFIKNLQPCLILFCVVELIGALGCGGYTEATHRVETTTARSTLESVLKSWQGGATPDSWQEKKPQVVVQDMDWKGGAKLHSFEFLDEDKPIDANLYCRVKLKLEFPGKGKREQTVSYLVGTSPVLTVFRSPQP